jgi:hypothetical protein
MATKFFTVRKPRAAGLGLLERAVHCLDLGIAATVEHAAHDAGQAFLERHGELFERFETQCRQKRLSSALRSNPDMLSSA